MGETTVLTVFRGDYGYLLSWTLQNSDGTAFNLGTGGSAYAVHLKVWPMGKSSQLFVNGACTIVSASAGTITYKVTQNDFLEAGTFYAEYEATKTSDIESFNTFKIIVKESP